MNNSSCSVCRGENWVLSDLVSLMLLVSNLMIMFLLFSFATGYNNTRCCDLSVCVYSCSRNVNTGN